MTVYCYVLYVAFSIGLTVWLGATLYREGRPFLVECLQDAAGLADAVNQLLLAGFYLINFAWIVLSLKSNQSPSTIVDSMEFLSIRIGLVSLVLGAIHLMNLWILTRIRRQRIAVL